jgi:hypothetical protein
MRHMATVNKIVINMMMLPSIGSVMMKHRVHKSNMLWPKSVSGASLVNS